MNNLACTRSSLTTAYNGCTKRWLPDKRTNRTTLTEIWQTKCRHRRHILVQIFWSDPGVGFYCFILLLLPHCILATEIQHQTTSASADCSFFTVQSKHLAGLSIHYMYTVHPRHHKRISRTTAGTQHADPTQIDKIKPSISQATPWTPRDKRPSRLGQSE